MKTICFSYTNAKGEKSDRSGILVAEMGDYFRVKEADGQVPKTFRKDRVGQYISGQDQLENPDAVNDYSTKVANQSGKPRKTNHKKLPEVCFTGFTKADKVVLEADAKAYGFYPTPRSVTVNLLALVSGDNAGPVKVKKARDQGCLILTADQFYLLAETGEIPEFNEMME